MRVKLSAWLLLALSTSVVGAAPTNITLPYFPSSTHPLGHGFARIINHSNQSGDVSIRATDDSGMRAGPITLTIGGGQTVHINALDLEQGKSSKGLSGGLGSGAGDWWLDLSSTLNIEALSYMRSINGFLTSMSEFVPGIANRHRVAVFNPGSNDDQVSKLRLVNPANEPAEIHIQGIDDQGGSAQIILSIPPTTAVNLTASQLESGAATGLPANVQISGALGDGHGKWQLIVTANVPVMVVNLLESRAQHLTNLSAVPNLLWRGLTVAPPSRCSGHPYERNEYGTRYRSKEDDIIEQLGGIYGPYTGQCYNSNRETTIEHIVAINEAHYSGLCSADSETKQTFAGDLLNLTLASSEVNSTKGSRDAFDWLPEQNECWFARRVLDVKLKYAMTVDRDEATALEQVLAGCDNTELARSVCAN